MKESSTKRTKPANKPTVGEEEVALLPDGDDPGVAKMWAKYFHSAKKVKRNGSYDPTPAYSESASQAEPMKFKSVQMPPAFWNDLLDHAKARNVSLHFLMRYILLHWMANNKNKEALGGIPVKKEAALYKIAEPVEIRSCDGRR